MIYVMFFLLGSLTSLVGSICGIGGGIILKPVLDAFGMWDAATINFLSGCTVFSMAAWNFGQSAAKKQFDFDMKVTAPMAVGAAIGGIIGKTMFSYAEVALGNDQLLTAIQMIILIVITLATLIYTIKKASIKTLQLTNMGACLAIGVTLGILSSFLGIGGGPFNLMFLGYFFSFSTKKAAQSSLFIILLSQMTSLGQTVLSGIPAGVDMIALIFLAVSGIAGAIGGKTMNKKMDDKAVDKLFIGLILVILALCVYNLVKAL